MIFIYEKTLDRMHIKVRRYVSRLSQERLRDDELNEFIFEAMRYDLEEDLGFNKIESAFDLITIPNIDTYNLSKISIPETNGQSTVQVIDLYDNFFPPAELENGCLHWVKKIILVFVLEINME